MIFLVGILVGAILGLTGAGGSVFALPLLISLAGLAPAQAVGVSLGAVGVTASFGVLLQLRSKNIQWLPALVFAAIGSLFAPLGNWLSQQISTPWLLTGFSLLVLVVASRIWQRAELHPDSAAVMRGTAQTEPAPREAICRGNDNSPFKPGPRCIAIMSGSAIATGILSGLFGVGGGFVIVPALLAITAISMRQAVATSLAIIAIISLAGFASFMFSAAAVSYQILGMTAAGGILGMAASSWAGQSMAGPTLQKAFVVFMVCAALFTLYTAINSI